jgi:hypothetical protein
LLISQRRQRLVSMAIMEFSSAGPGHQVDFGAAAAWWLGLVVTKHRLLAQIGMAIDGMAVGLPWLPLSGIRAGEKSL